MPDRSPGRVILRDRVRARVALSAVLRTLSDYAMAAVPATADAHGDPTDALVVSRRMQAILLEVKFRSVVVGLVYGATWYDVARTLRVVDADGQPDERGVREVYEDFYEHWKAGEEQVWTPQGGIPVCPEADDDPLAVAASLDRWYAARHRDGSIRPDEQVVSGPLGLTRG